jgi:hypothetical protein
MQLGDKHIFGAHIYAGRAATMTLSRQRKRACADDTTTICKQPSDDALVGLPMASTRMRRKKPCARGMPGRHDRGGRHGGSPAASAKCNSAVQSEPLVYIHAYTLAAPTAWAGEFVDTTLPRQHTCSRSRRQYTSLSASLPPSAMLDAESSTVRAGPVNHL